MDLQYLIDRLETMVTGAKRVPITGKLMFDEQELADLIDQMRTVLPEEVRAARKVLRERDSIISEAQQQADEVLKTALAGPLPAPIPPEVAAAAEVVDVDTDDAITH